MSAFVIVTLLLVNSLLVLAMILVLLSVLKQGKRIARLARESRELADEVQARADDSPDSEEET